MRLDVTDNPVISGMSRIFDMMCLNVLWLVCSLPIFTIGASTTAMYTVMLKVVKNEEGYIVKGFLRHLKRILKEYDHLADPAGDRGVPGGRFISDEFGQRFCGNGVKSDLCSTGTAGTCSRDLCICTDREI